MKATARCAGTGSSPSPRWPWRRAWCRPSPGNPRGPRYPGGLCRGFRRVGRPADRADPLSQRALLPLHRDLMVDDTHLRLADRGYCLRGAFYAYLDAAQAGLTVRPADYRALIQLGRSEACRRGCPHRGPSSGTGAAGGSMARLSTARCRAGGRPGQCLRVCRSGGRSLTDRNRHCRPGGTTLRARPARSRPAFVNESIIGTRFTGRVLEETRVGDLPAVIPRGGGPGLYLGFSQWAVDPADPVGGGFFLR